MVRFQRRRAWLQFIDHPALLIPVLLLMLCLCIDVCVSNALSFDDYFYLFFSNGREKDEKKNHCSVMIVLSSDTRSVAQKARL